MSTRLSNAYLIASCRINKLYYYDYVSGIKSECTAK
nr:MAG TPA: hypothetical protein [Caudoviricetes sp.]